MAQTQTPIVVGVFDNEANARVAVDALRNAGFAYDQVGVAMREGGATTPNLLNDLMNLGVPQDHAAFYDREFRAGRTVVSVRPDGRDQEAMDILRSNGAYDYNQSAMNAQDYRQAGTYTSGSTQTANYGQTDYRREDQTNYAQPGSYTQTAGSQQATSTQPSAYDQTTDYVDTDEARSLKLREEQLQVNKERVQTGEVQLHKEVVTEQKTLNVPVMHEEVMIERRPVPGGRVDNTPITEDETIRIPVSEEQVQVSKTPMVTGEVAIGKRTVQENQQVSDTIKREEVHLEHSGDPRISGDIDIDNPAPNNP